MRLDYRVVDVFTQNALEGNPLAVFPNAGTLDGVAMQRIAREMNLSETTFLSPPTLPACVAKVRIFTPVAEMPFAGHPTLGTSFVLRESGVVARGTSHFALEELVGAVPVRVDPDDDELLWFTMPPIEARETYDAQMCAEMLGLSAGEMHAAKPQNYATANGNLFVALASAEAVDRASFDAAAFARFASSHARPPDSVFVFAQTPSGAYSRMFSPALGVPEDPATGSATGPLAAYMMDCGMLSRRDGMRLISEQGTKMGRRSLLHVLVSRDGAATKIEVGGHTTPIAIGTMTLPDGPRS